MTQLNPVDLVDRAAGLQRKFGRLDIGSMAEHLRITRSEAAEVMKAMKNGTTSNRKTSKKSSSSGKKAPASGQKRRSRKKGSGY